MNSTATRKSSFLAKSMSLLLGVVVVTFLWISLYPHPVITKVVLGTNEYSLPAGYIISALENKENNRYYGRASLPDISIAKSSDVRDPNHVEIFLTHISNTENPSAADGTSLMISNGYKKIDDKGLYKKYQRQNGEYIWRNDVKNIGIRCLISGTNPTCNVIGPINENSGLRISLTERPPEELEAAFNQVSVFIQQHEVPK